MLLVQEVQALLQLLLCEAKVVCQELPQKAMMLDAQLPDPICVVGELRITKELAPLRGAGKLQDRSISERAKYLLH